jgi:hypothetical protein
VTAGYSGTPLPRKLGIKEGHRVAVLRAPDGFTDTLGQLPERVSLSDGRLRAPHDVIVAFFSDRRTLERRLASLIAAMHPSGGLWIAWPKRTSGVASDITEEVVRRLGVEAGLVDNKVCAIDETWSGLRLVVRLRDR